MASSDFTNHGKFASGDVVGAIGERLAEGQSLTDAKGGLVESLGMFTSGAINVAAGVAKGAVAVAGRGARSDEKRKVGRHGGASDVIEPVTARRRARSRRLDAQLQKAAGREAHRGQLQAGRRRKLRTPQAKSDRSRPPRSARARSASCRPTSARFRFWLATYLRTTSRLASGASITTLVPSQPGKPPPPLAR